MNHLFNFLVIGLIAVNLAGLALIGQSWMRVPYGLSKSVSAVLVCLFFFFLEHFVGLGGLMWLLPFTTGVSALVIWKKRAVLCENKWSETVFLGGMGYALLWRYTFPDIDASSEKIADFNFIASYMQGTQLPPLDLWLPPYKLTQYYSLQHYGAALMGRIFGLAPGAAYNLGYCVLVGLVMAPAYEFLRLMQTTKYARMLILAAFLFGGSGACIFTPFMTKTHDDSWVREKLWASMRFVGSTTAEPDKNLTNFGRWVKSFGPNSDNKELHMEMPMEIFSYVVQLGDYHAPLGGYLTLTMALAAFGLLLRDPANRMAQAILAGTLPLTIATNTWSFPLQFLLAGGCFLYLLGTRKDAANPAWWLCGAGAVSVLLYPFFAYFLPRSIGQDTAFRIAELSQLTPPVFYLMLFWPIFVLIVLAFFTARAERQWLWTWSLFWVLMLVFTEVSFFDDIYSGRFERFNTTLKWWPWVYAAAILTLGAVASRSTSRAIRLTLVTVLAMILTYLGALGATFWKERKNSGQQVGKLDGTGWLRGDEDVPSGEKHVSHVLNFLEANKGGVLLDRPEEQAFNQTGVIALFTGHPAVVGWTSHEQLWRGYQADIESRYAAAKAFYEGTLENPLDFLDLYDVRFVLWLDEGDEELFQKVNGQISSWFYWRQFGHERIGVWERK